jgi:glycosyltransferase involved in cell wall biosynthesis
MRIGLIIYGSLDTLSGGYLYDRKLVESLRARGDRVEIISLPWRSYAAHLLDNIRFRLPKSDVVSRRALSPTTAERASGKQSPANKRFDILIEDELNHPSLIFANRGRHPYPIISLVHHLRCSELRPKWQNAFYARVEKKYLRSVDGFIFNSKTTEGVVHELLDDEKPSVLAYPPTDRFGEPISETDIVERAKAEEFRILFLGNVIHRKGLHTLLQAVSAQPSAFRIDVIGSLTSEPQYARQIEKFISDNHLSSFLFLHGPLDKEPLIEKLRQAHVLVVPSSYEGFGIVYLEGMCFGLPAIGTTAGAANEIISDGVDGFLIQPENADELAEKLKALSENREMLIQMSLAARDRYLHQPKWEETAGRIREYLLKRIAAYSV